MLNVTNRKPCKVCLSLSHFTCTHLVCAACRIGLHCEACEYADALARRLQDVTIANRIASLERDIDALSMRARF